MQENEVLLFQVHNNNNNNNNNSCKIPICAQEVAALNGQYRGVSRPTDVLYWARRFVLNTTFP